MRTLYVEYWQIKSHTSFLKIDIIYHRINSDVFIIGNLSTSILHHFGANFEDSLMVHKFYYITFIIKEASFFNFQLIAYN